MDKLIVSLGAAILGLFLYEKATQTPETKTLAKSVPISDNPVTATTTELLPNAPDPTESLDDIAGDSADSEVIQAGN